MLPRDYSVGERGDIAQVLAVYSESALPGMTRQAGRTKWINGTILSQKYRGYVERFATPKKQIIEYAGAHHTLEFESDPDRFIGDVKNWLEKHADGAPP